jgi:hypothetical protein
MYAGFNGATCIEACCIDFRVHICGKICFLASRIEKRGLQVYIGKGKRPSEQVACGEVNLAITT